MKYYEAFYQPKKPSGWFFIIPDKDGPFPGDGDVLVGPYITQAKAQEDADECRSKAVTV